MNRNVIIPLLLFLASAWTLSSQEASLSVEREEVAVTIGGIESVASQVELPAAPDFVEGGSIDVEERLDPMVPLPRIPDPEPEMGITVTDVGDSLSVVGTFGGGSASTVLGSIEVSRFGNGPDFHFSYEQDRRDGGFDRNPGTGFQSQVHALETEILLEDEDRGLVGTASFVTRQRGLQGLSQYHSADLRSIDGTVEGYLAPSESLRFSGGIFAGDYRRVLAVTSDQGAPVLSRSAVAPFLSLELSFPRVTVETGASYRGNWFSGVEHPSVHRFGLSLSGDIVLRPGTRLFLSAEAGYQNGYGALFPASLTLESDISRALFVSASIQHTLRTNYFDGIWTDVSTIDPTALTDILGTPEEGLGGSISTEWRIVPEQFILIGDLGYMSRSSALDIAPYDSVSGLTPVEMDDRDELTSTIRSRIASGGWNGEVFWLQRWLDRGVMEARTEAGISLSYRTERLRLFLDSTLPYFDAFDLPLVDFRAEYVIAPTAFLSLFVDDTLSPFAREERTVYGAFTDDSHPFAAEGMRVGATVSVRL